MHRSREQRRSSTSGQMLETVSAGRRESTELLLHGTKAAPQLLFGSGSKGCKARCFVLVALGACALLLMHRLTTGQQQQGHQQPHLALMLPDDHHPAATPPKLQQQQQQRQQQRQQEGTGQLERGSRSSMGRPPEEQQDQQGQQQPVAQLDKHQQQQQQQQDQVHFLDAQPHLKTTEDMLRAQPTVYGAVEKAGILNWDDWSMRHAADRVEDFVGWRLNRSKGLPPADDSSYTCRAADHPPSSYPGCHVFVNEKYKFLYIRSPKAASTTIVDELGECTNMNTRGHNASTCMSEHQYWEHWYKPEQLQAMWKDYFVFGFVRNPWRRAYSLYNYMQSDGCLADGKIQKDANLDDEPVPGCRMQWQDFCRDPWQQVEGLHQQGCMKRTWSYLYFHMQDQYHCFRTATGDWAVDFIGRVEHTNEDWAKVVEEINKRRPEGLPAIPVAELEAKNSRVAHFKDPYKDHPQCIDSVSRWYACDAEKFAYRKAQRETDTEAKTEPR